MNSVRKLAAGLTTVALIGCTYFAASQLAFAEPEEQQPTLSEVVERMAKSDVRQRLAKLPDSEREAMQFCRDPEGWLREAGIRVPRGTQVTGKIVSSEEGPGHEANIDENEGSTVPIIYAVVCMKIGNLRICWNSYDLRDRGWDNLPELIKPIESTNVVGTISRDLQSSASFGILRDPKGYLGKNGVKVPSSMTVRASLHGPAIPPNTNSICSSIQVSSPGVAVDLGICDSPRASLGQSADAECCTSKPTR